MTTKFWGHGREDDEFYLRLEKAGLKVKLSWSYDVLNFNDAGVTQTLRFRYMCAEYKPFQCKGFFRRKHKDAMIF